MGKSIAFMGDILYNSKKIAPHPTNPHNYDIITYMKNIIRKADIVLFIILILLGGILTVSSLISGADKTQVVIKVEGKVYGTYSLSKDQTITIEEYGHYNRVEIKDGKVQMMEANCHNQLCVNQGAITTSNIPIVCLPNRVVVEIVDGEEEVDVLSR